MPIPYKRKLVSRASEERITLTRRTLCKFAAKEYGVSYEALCAAMDILCKSMITCLARGYRVTWRGVCSFEVRELQPRKRYNRTEQRYYTHPASCRVHIKNAPGLNQAIRELAEKELERAVHRLSMFDTK